MKDLLISKVVWRGLSYRLPKQGYKVLTGKHFFRYFKDSLGIHLKTH